MKTRYAADIRDAILTARHNPQRPLIGVVHKGLHHTFVWWNAYFYTLMRTGGKHHTR